MINNQILFLSHVLSSETVGYGGRKEFQTTRTLNLQNGDSCNQSEWKLSNHIGTHIDSPFHFSSKGKTLDAFDASFWVFSNVHFVEMPVNESTIIEKGDWSEKIPFDCDFLILKTGFESKRNSKSYWAHNPGLSPELGIWLREFRPKIRVIGFDFISITSYDHRPLGKKAHNAFLHEEHVGTPILAIEDMHLSELREAPKKLIVAPIRVLDSDGSPVTVIAEL
jgi:kynurenine formamidase